MKPLQGKEIVRILLLAGWRRVGVRGIHFVLEGPDGARVTTPDLGKAPLRRETAERILSFAGLRP